MRFLLPLAGALVGIGLLARDALLEPRITALAYLLVFVGFLSLSIGTLLVAMVCDACGAVWFVAVRRAAEAWSAALPVHALLFLPLMVALPWLYPWAGPEPTQAHARALLLHRAGYNNPPAFLLRAVVVFACWIAIAECMRWWSLRQDRQPMIDLSHRRRALASAGLIPMALTVTAAAIDWIMSLDVAWSSTIVGLQVLVDCYTAGLCVIILLIPRWGMDRPPLGLVDEEHRHALGKLLFVGVVLWAYLQISQFLVVWMGDIPEEAAWYVARFTAGWGVLALVVCFLHFVVPFAVLMPRSAKRSSRVLVTMAVCVLAAHALDLIWMIIPSGVGWHWQEGLGCLLSAALAVGGLTRVLILWRARGVEVRPQGDPDLPAALAYESLP